MLINVDCHYCTLVKLVDSKRFISGRSLHPGIQPHPPLAPFLSTTLTLAGHIVSDGQLVGLGQREALVKQWG